jgi:sn-glycerol 3-phosphate transport system substrate-binding protein
VPHHDRSGRDPLLSRRRFLELAGLSVPAGLVLAACGGGGGSPSGSQGTFPIGAAARASSKPVKVTLWHSMASQELTTLNNLADKFNASQSDVQVSLVAQTGYPATLAAFTTALSGGGLPDIVQMENVDLQLMIDSKSIVPVQSAVEADHYDLSDFLPSSLAYYTVGGALQAMPFNISTQVLYYDKGAFTRAGLDPDTPPKTLDEVRTACEKIVSSGAEKYGMSIKITASNVEQWISLGDGLLLDPGNGRSSRATSAAFGDALGKSIYEWYGEMLSSHYAQATGGNSYDNLLGIPSKVAPMTTDTSAALGEITKLLASNQFPGVVLGVGPLPGPLAAGGGVTVGGAAMFLVSASPAERQDGAWQFVKFLSQTDSQATWAAETGYLPIRRSCVSTATIESAWASVPGQKVAYDQLADSPADVATAGAVCGAMPNVETAIVNALTAISNGTSADSAVSSAVGAANQAIASYNSSI